MINPSRTRRHRINIPFKCFGGSYRTHVSMQDLATDCKIEFDESFISESKYYMYNPEKSTESINKKDIFKEYADIVDDTLLSIIENDINEIIKKYDSNLKYSIDYDIDPEEQTSYLLIKLSNRLPVDEEIRLSKHIWRSMRKKGHKELMKKLHIVVEYE